MCRANSNVNFAASVTVATIQATGFTSAVTHCNYNDVAQQAQPQQCQPPMPHLAHQAVGHFPIATCATNGESLVFANKYKTKFCRHYEEDSTSAHGFSCKCPYKKKCMFAHSPDELRTTEMNIADGIMTQEDIRAWKKRVKAQARLAENAAAGAVDAPTTDGAEVEDHTADDHTAQLQLEVAGSRCYVRPHHPHKYPATPRSEVGSTGEDVLTSHGGYTNSSISGAASQCSSFIPIECGNHQRPLSKKEQSQGFYTHSPYGGFEATCSWEYNPACPCEQCLSHDCLSSAPEQFGLSY